MKILVLTLALAFQSGRVTRAITPPGDVQKMVEPILDLCVRADASQGEAQNKASWKAARLIGALLDSKAKSSDEALVVLMNFYIGESTGADL